MRLSCPLLTSDLSACNQQINAIVPNKEHNADFSKLSEVEEFVKVSGLEPKYLDKLLVKKGELNEEQLELVILSRYGR